MSLLLAAHFAITWALVGLIWVIQTVHYPLMAWVGQAERQRYQLQHVSRMGRLVIPLMLSEAFLTVYLCFTSTSLTHPWLAWLGAALLLIVWAVTGAFSVPAHNKLVSDVPSQALANLVSTNWIRTIAWTGRGVVALFMAMPSPIT